MARRQLEAERQPGAVPAPADEPVPVVHGSWSAFPGMTSRHPPAPGFAAARASWKGTSSLPAGSVVPVSKERVVTGHQPAEKPGAPPEPADLPAPDVPVPQRACPGMTLPHPPDPTTAVVHGTLKAFFVPLPAPVVPAPESRSMALEPVEKSAAAPPPPALPFPVPAAFAHSPPRPVFLRNQQVLPVERHVPLPTADPGTILADSVRRHVAALIPISPHHREPTPVEFCQRGSPPNGHVP